MKIYMCTKQKIPKTPETKGPRHTEGFIRRETKGLKKTPIRILKSHP